MPGLGLLSDLFSLFTLSAFLLYKLNYVNLKLLHFLNLGNHVIFCLDGGLQLVGRVGLDFTHVAHCGFHFHMHCPYHRT